MSEHPTSAPPTSGSGGSSSPGLPTPTARDWKGQGHEGQLPNAVNLLPTPTTSEGTGVGHAAHGGMNLRHAISLLPTPRASAQENRQTKRSPSQMAGRHGLNLAAEVAALLPTPSATRGGSATETTALLPTPQATDGTKGGPNQRGSSGDLMLPSAVQRLLPTPRASDTGTPGRRASEGFRPPLSQVLLPVSSGDPTDPPSPAGRPSSGAPHPGQLTIEDALTRPSSNG